MKISTIFQLTPPHGRRLLSRVSKSSLMPFQLTPPHGRRRAIVYTSVQNSNFNSRLRTGGDCIICLDICHIKISTHASAREATSRMVYGIYHRTFQLTPPHGRRRLTLLPTSICKVFQLTPPHGRRRLKMSIYDTPYLFQLTPPHGRRHTLAGFQNYEITISTHASAREATRMLNCFIR